MGLMWRLGSGPPLNCLSVQNFTAARPSGEPSAATTRLECIGFHGRSRGALWTNPAVVKGDGQFLKARLLAAETLITSYL